MTLAAFTESATQPAKRAIASRFPCSIPPTRADGRSA